MRRAKVTAFINCGAYTTSALVMLDHSVYGVSGNYRNPCLWVDAYGVYTNTENNGPYRALGCELFVYAIERNLDLAAEALGMNKYDIRKINVLRKGDIDGHGQLVYNNGSDEAITAAAKFIEWDKAAHAPEGPGDMARDFPSAISSPPTARPAPRQTSPFSTTTRSR